MARRDGREGVRRAVKRRGRGGKWKEGTGEGSGEKAQRGTVKRGRGEK